MGSHMGDTERDREMEDRDMEQRGQESRAKKASAVFERKTSDGQSFWSLSARNSVQSMFSCSTDNNHQQGEAEASESPRKMLQKKRSSLCHQSEVTRALESRASQEQVTLHEFQKVMSGLKRVEDQKYEMKKLSSTNNLEPCQTDGKEGGKEDVGSKNADGNGNESIKRESDSTDKKASSDLNSKLREDKSSSALKKKQVNKTGGKTAAQSKSVAPPASKKQTLKPQNSAPARSSSLRSNKKQTESSETPASKSSLSGPQQRKVKPDTIAAHKNPTRSRSSSPQSKVEEKSPSVKPAKGTGPRPVTRTRSLRTKLERSASSDVATSSSLKKPVSKTASKAGPSRPAGKSDRRPKEETAQTAQTAQTAPPPVLPKPKAQPAKKTSELAGGSQSKIELARGSPSKKVPPPVAPKPGQRRFNLTGLNDIEASRQSKHVKPVVKKMAAKTSLAELARLADSQALEVVVRETLHQTQFVSQAQTTLSPSTTRKIRSNTGNVEDSEEEPEKKEEEEEGGIISQSVSASSVIQMFGGVGRFKKAGSNVTSPSSEKAPSPVEESTKVPELKRSESRGGVGVGEKSVRRQSSSSSVARKTSSQTRVKKTSAGPTQRKKSSSASAPAPAGEKKRSVPRVRPGEGTASTATNVVKTTMTVRLQSGHSRKVSNKEQDQKEQVTEVKKEEKISFNPVDQVIDDIKLIGENVEQEVAEVQEEDVVQEIAEVQDEDVVQEVSEVQEEDVEQEIAEVQEEDVEQEVSEVQEEDVEQEEEQEQEQEEVEDMAENVEIDDDSPVKGAQTATISSSSLTVTSGPDKSRQ